jgi:hypothetical protein
VALRNNNHVYYRVIIVHRGGKAKVGGKLQKIISQGGLQSLEKGSCKEALNNGNGTSIQKLNPIYKSQFGPYLYSPT